MPYKDPDKRREYLRKAATKRRSDPEKRKQMYEATEKWFRENRERVMAQRKAHRHENLQAAKEKRREYIKKNIEKVRAMKLRWRIENPEKVREHTRRQKEGFKINPTPLKASQKRYRMANKEKVLLRLYGITQQEWAELFETQGRRCQICGNDKATKYDTDHCHITQKVRGILCHKCNLMLGLVRDSIQTLEAAIQYLKGAV